MLINALGSALLSGYGREHELEADRLGAAYLARTRYDPQAMIRAFDRHNPDHPFVSLFVVVGTLYTLLTVYLIDGFDVSAATCGHEGWLRWDTTLTAFVVSGLPMIAGNISRWSRSR